VRDCNQIKKKNSHSLSPKNQQCSNGCSPPMTKCQGNDDDESETDPYDGLFDDDKRRLKSY